jgi:hypothetical protein
MSKVGKKWNACGNLVGNAGEKWHKEELNADERILLKWILDKLVGMLWTGFIWLRNGPCARVP